MVGSNSGCQVGGYWVMPITSSSLAAQAGRWVARDRHSAARTAISRIELLPAQCAHCRAPRSTAMNLRVPAAFTSARISRNNGRSGAVRETYRHLRRDQLTPRTNPTTTGIGEHAMKTLLGSV